MSETTRNEKLPTPEEIALVREAILLPFILEIAEKNRASMERTTLTFKPLYLTAIDKVIKIIWNDLKRIKAELKKRDIKVIEEDQNEFIMYYRYFCRGYEERFGIMKEVARAEMGVRSGKYMAEVFR